MKKPHASPHSLLLFALFALAIFGCEKETHTPAPNRSAVTTLTLGVLPEQNIFAQKQRYERLFKAIEKNGQFHLIARILPNYGAIFEDFKTGRVDGAFLGSFQAVSVLKSFDTTPVAMQLANDGTSTYRSVIIARQDSSFSADPGSWAGARFGFVDRHTSAGFLYPIQLFKAKGINYRTYLSGFHFLGSHDAVLFAVREGRVDIGALKDKIFFKLLEQHPAMAQKVRILKTSAPYPAVTLIVKSSLPQNELNALKKQFLHLHDTTDGQATLTRIGLKRFIPSNKQTFDQMWRQIQSIRPASPLEHPASGPAGNNP